MAMNIDFIFLIFLVIGALLTVLTGSLLRSAIALAFTSAVLSVLIFRLGSPLAAVFELSVCSGLITVLFISSISLTDPLTKKEEMQHMKDRLKRFAWLPLIAVAIGLTLSFVAVKPNLKLPAPEKENDARVVLWNQRGLDVAGQIIIILSGVFGVVILFKEPEKK